MSRGTTTPSADSTSAHSDPFDVVTVEAPDGSVPVEEYLESIPPAVAARIVATVDVVAKAPPHRFSGGGLWKPMRGNMGGWYEVTIDHQRKHYRVFCLLDARAEGRGPLLVMVDGRTKDRGSLISAREFKKINKLRDHYLSKQPRPIA